MIFVGCSWSYRGVIVHIFLAEEREYYGLERLWNDCPQIELPDFDKIGFAGAQTAGEGLTNQEPNR